MAREKQAADGSGPRLLVHRTPRPFWEAAEALVAASAIVVERPKGSRHPSYPTSVYPCAYGYLQGSRGSDGDEIDIWIGSSKPPRVSGVIVTLDAGKGDAEAKLLWSCSPAEARKILAFHNRGAQRGYLIMR